VITPEKEMRMNVEKDKTKLSSFIENLSIHL
jgi:hypothetical protein